MGDDEDDKPNAEGSEESQQVPIQNLSVQQLNMFKQQLEGEIQELTENCSGMKGAAIRFGHSKEALEMLKPENEGREIMVPLSISVYIDGKIAQPTRAMVDVGTGYFIEQSTEGAKKVCNEKVKMLEGTLEKIVKVTSEKKKMLEEISMTMQRKVMQMQMEEQKAQAAGGSA